VYLTVDTIQRKINGARAKVKHTGDTKTAALKVSFFGPFYGGYNVIKLDDEYKYALVSGPNREYLWILARTPTIPDKVKADYARTAQKLGFNVNELLWVKQ